MKTKNQTPTNNHDGQANFVVKTRLSVKLILMTVLILTAAIITLAILVINSGAKIIDQGSEADALEYVEEAANHIGQAIAGNLATLNEVARRESITSMDFASQAAALADSIERLGYQDIAIMDLNGHAKYLVGGGEFDSWGEFWYEEGFKGNNSVSDVTISKVTKEPVVFDVAPIIKNGQVAGLLVGRRDPTFLKNIVNNLGDGTNKYGMVISESGLMMAHPNDQLILDQTNVFDNIEKDGPNAMGARLKEIAPQSVTHISYDFNGDTKLAYVAPVPGTSWNLLVTESEAVMLAPINQLRNTIIILGLVIMVAGAAVAFVISKRIVKPVLAANGLIKEIYDGHLSQRLEITSQDEVGEMTDSLNQLADTLQFGIMGLMKKIADGDLSADIMVTDPLDEVKPVLKQTVETIRALIAEATMLSRAALAGDWKTRGNADAFKGGFKEIVEGVNNTLDAVVGPLNVAADYVDQIGKGQIPEKITETYNGDFNTLKNSINACIDGLGALVESNRVLAKMSLNDYSETMSTNYQGIFAEIGHSINDVHTRLTRIVEISTNIANGDMRDLEVLSKVGKRSDNDTLIPALVGMIQNIINLVDETEKMASIAIEGNLSNRGDVSGFPGEYGKIVTGFNQTLDAVIAPIEEASATLTQLSQGNLHTKMQGDYRGDHAQIKEALNGTITFLSEYVEEITHTLEQIGQGNLDLEITNEYLGDFQAIKTALNDITSSLSTTMSDINDAAGQVEAGATQISDGGQALAQGTTEQASSIQELTASMEEVAGETKQNAKFANQANELANNVKVKAEIGNSQMTNMVAAMVEINEASSNISKIIKVIDDIAFQTNILALNAAVEAARAGQHGKGFAVVAEEVRTLAARSAEAAKETTALIEGSISKTDAGTKIADETAESLKEILSEVETVTSLVGNIAQASNDQASEIAQINQGIEQVSQVVQTNSATAEQSAAASEELSGQAEILKQMVGAFRLKGKHHSNSSRTVTQLAVKPVSPVTPQIDIFLNDEEMDKY
ncbi:HAMP domain-containing protein [Acetobacterium wieringae]|uniref:HAMP domain-containing protein n=1 Tax=Acetobacterium wieringae TaxID=52694 RepID=A0A5D0WKD4_9FIRM|nr:methyl-accepting chemotaxis protein [Acetobacterium wieringae]TYC84785.1 HAMP domain-containing protein [Acetobacterium wieringae]